MAKVDDDNEQQQETSEGHGPLARLALYFILFAILLLIFADAHGMIHDPQIQTVTMANGSPS